MISYNYIAYNLFMQPQHSPEPIANVESSKV